MKFFHLASIALGATASAQSTAASNIDDLTAAAPDLVADFAGLDLVLNGTLAQVHATRDAILNLNSLASNQENITKYSDVFVLLGTYQPLVRQVQTTMDNLLSKKSDIVASPQCKDIYTQLGLVWFFSVGSISTIGKKLPADGSSVWHRSMDPMTTKLREAYESLKECS